MFTDTLLPWIAVLGCLPQVSCKADLASLDRESLRVAPKGTEQSPANTQPATLGWSSHNMEPHTASTPFADDHLGEKVCLLRSI